MISKRVFVTAMLILGLMICMTSTGVAQSKKGKGGGDFEYRNMWRIELGLVAGFGLDNHKLGVTEDDEDIEISAGGGVGGTFAIGMPLGDYIDIGVGIGYQVSELTPEVKNAEGKFERTCFRTDIEYKVPISSIFRVYLGAGFGYYIPGDLDLDFSELYEGAHNVYSYDDGMGFHITFGFESYRPSSSMFWRLGVIYSSVTYDLNAVESDGVEIPIEYLSSDIMDEVGELDGGGFDFYLSLGYYFR